MSLEDAFDDLKTWLRMRLGLVLGCSKHVRHLRNISWILWEALRQAPRGAIINSNLAPVGFIGANMTQDIRYVWINTGEES